MSLSYAGVPLLLQTADHEAWQQLYHDFYRTQLTSNWGWQGTDISYLSLPPKPEEFTIDIGVLKWPISASRPSSFFTLINSTSLDLIRAAWDDSGVYQSLVMDDGNGDDHTITVSLRPAVAPLPLHQVADTEQLFLLCLTDQRWEWRQRTGDLSSVPASWAAAYSTIATALGITVTPETVNSNYSTPSTRWKVYRKPLPTLLDAVANTVGQRVVVGLDGTVTTVGFAAANTAADSQYDSVRKLAGGTIAEEDIQRVVPESVIVVFGDSTAAAPHTVTKTLSSLAITGYGSATGVAGAVQTVFADLIYDGTNTSACATLATRAATDWYGWLLSVYDVTLPGIWNWEPTGAEESIEWSYADGGRLLTRLRVGPLQEQPLGGFKTPATTLTVEQVTGGTPVTDVTTIQFDEGDGFAVTSPSAGIAKINVTTSGGTTGFFARITSVSGVNCNFKKLKLSSGAYVDDGAEVTGNNAVPLKADGSNYFSVPVAGMRVWMIPSQQSGKYEFLPTYFPSTPFGVASKGFDTTITTDDTETGTGAFTVPSGVPSSSSLWFSVSVAYNYAFSSGTGWVTAYIKNQTTSATTPAIYLPLPPSVAPYPFVVNFSGLILASTGDSLELCAVRHTSGTFSVCQIYDAPLTEMWFRKMYP